MDNNENMENMENMENVENVQPAEAQAVVQEEKKEYSSFRYAWGAFLAFFGISSKTHRASKKRAKLVADIATYVVLIFGAFLMVYPFWWMLAGSFAYTGGQLVNLEILKELKWWPRVSTLNSGEEHVNFFYNYKILFTSGMVNELNTDGTIKTTPYNVNFNYWVALGNNLFYSIVPVVVGVITSASAAFSFAKIEWIGRNKVFFFLLAAIMVPGASIMMAQYALYFEMGFTDNWAVMVIPGLFGSIMTAFFIRQFLFSMPTSIIEAAKIDGAGYFRIFTQFILPLAMPAIMAQGLLSFMGCWNNYVGSYIFIKETSIWVNLPHAMQIMEGKQGNNMGPVIAASVMCVLPVLILFGCFQKLIIGSLMLTGSKE